ncbi:hypothetical protein [Streptomyces noursei]|uniref:hypothetical protein n=1 Tax=Streptomyces noursei TaxID=1971 RepID=UPI0019D6CE11|nr:hypothetical protein [Streptomyces noursei]
MNARSGLLARITTFLLHGRRARLDHPGAHRAARPDQHAGLAMHYRPSSPSAGGSGSSGFPS